MTSTALLVVFVALATLSQGVAVHDTPVPGTRPWNITLINKTVAGAADGVVFVTSLNYIFGGFNATIEAVDAATGGLLWTDSTYGELEIPLSFYAFDSAPGVVFFVVNNVRPTQLVAYNTRSGDTSWELSYAGLSNVVASPGGSIVFAISAIAGTSQAAVLSIDVASGMTLTTWPALTLPVYPLLCGPSRKVCLAAWHMRNYFNGTVEAFVSLFDAQTGDEKSHPVSSAFGFQIWGMEDVLLIGSPGQYVLKRLDTATFDTLWSLQINFPLLSTAVVARFFNATWGKESRALVSASQYQTTAIDLQWGVVLPSASPSVTCPTGAPAPSTAAQLWSATFTPFVSGMVAAVIQCTYNYNGNGPVVNIYAAFNVANMTAPVWWRYTSASYYNAFIPVSPTRFLLVNEYDTATVSTADVYDVASFRPVRQYKWSSLPYAETYSSQPLMGWTTKGLTILQQQLASPPSSFYLASVA